MAEAEGRRGRARRVVELEGHLLDSSLMSDALDQVELAGAAARVLQFRAGRTRDETSWASLEVSADDEAAVERTLAALIGLGARVPAADVTDARLEPAPADGVAPADFYATTIYPTEVRVEGRWLLARDQRMDAVIVAHGGIAACRLIRDLRAGDLVVCGADGIRTVAPPPADAGTAPHDESFAFMASGVSSERRVELVVARLADELEAVRRRDGRTVVVAGPVVVHTGGAAHLAALIRAGYVQALLAGNALAVHDIERALYGTSLGVDMERGTGVPGGHRNHLRAINTIRACGSIRRAVEQGVLTSGVMHACIVQGVPFSLAGSIRDDGPLPDTEMDLIRAQDDYARLLRGADVVLMLSSMLHSIGVGNMTPAGVRLVCVDINPAVVTKLADRGSLESMGVVTDVGLFLSLLVKRLGLA